MKTLHRTSIGLIAGALLLGTAACSESYDREEFISEAETEMGITNEQATCLADNLESALGSDRLTEIGLNEEEMSAEDEAAFTEAALECLFES
jgi:hypothetical protein